MKPRRVDKHLFLYGYGKLGKLAEEIFNELDIPIAGIFDKDSITFGTSDNTLVAVCVASEPYYPIEKKLKENGWDNVVPVYDIIEAYPEVGIRNGWFVGEGTKEDERGFIYVIERLNSFGSKMKYSAFVEWHDKREETEIILNTGKPCLDSTLAGIRDRQFVTSFYDAPMDKVEIHAEGYEIETIEGNMALFQKHRPKIEVAVYHSKDGLWKIQKTLMDNLKDYVFEFKVYAYMGQGAYLICTPEEKV